MKVYGHVSARDEDGSTNVYATAQRTNDYSYNDNDYAVPHVPHHHSQERIYQSVTNIVPGMSNSSLSSPSSADVSQSQSLYNTNPYHKPAYQKIRKHPLIRHRSSQHNIYQSLNNCHSMSKVDTYNDRSRHTKAKIEVKCIYFAVLNQNCIKDNFS